MSRPNPNPNPSPNPNPTLALTLKNRLSALTKHPDFNAGQKSGHARFFVKVRFKRLELHVFPVRRALSRDERQHLPRVPPTWPRARSRDLELHTLADPAFPARVRIYEKSKTAPIFKIPVALDSGDNSEQSKVGLMFNGCKNSWEFMFKEMIISQKSKTNIVLLFITSEYHHNHYPLFLLSFWSLGIHKQY